MKYRRVEADSQREKDTCGMCCFHRYDEDCINNECELDDSRGNSIAFYFIEEKGEEDGQAN
jgi:hypothetical protein